MYANIFVLHVLKRLIVILIDDRNNKESTAHQAYLVYELFNQYRIFYKQQPDIELAKKFIDARLNNNESVIFVALVDNKSKPAGFTQLYPNYSSVRAVKNWTLNDLYVDKDYRKQGIGEKLIKKQWNMQRTIMQILLSFQPLLIITQHKVFTNKLDLKSRSRIQHFILTELI